MITPREYRDSFALRVKQAREEAGYTQEVMARLLHVSQPTYSKWEGGRGNDPASQMPVYLIIDFCAICRVSPEWLLGSTTGSDAVQRPMRRPRRKTVA